VNDPVLELLASVEAEDAAQAKLWDAKNKTKHLILSNVSELINSGLLTIKINRSAVIRRRSGCRDCGSEVLR
jgi:hypothetical protein